MTKGLRTELGPETCVLSSLWQWAPHQQRCASGNLTTAHWGPQRDPSIPWGRIWPLHIQSWRWCRASDSACKSGRISTGGRARAVLVMGWTPGSWPSQFRHQVGRKQRREGGVEAAASSQHGARDASLPEQGRAQEDGTWKRDMGDHTALHTAHCPSSP